MARLSVEACGQSPAACVHSQKIRKRRQLLAYVEYFSWLRIVACLSQNYGGPSFSHCYAVDLVTGEDLELDVVLAIKRSGPFHQPKMSHLRQSKTAHIEVCRSLGTTRSQMLVLDRLLHQVENF